MRNPLWRIVCLLKYKIHSLFIVLYRRRWIADHAWFPDHSSDLLEDRAVDHYHSILDFFTSL